MFEGQAADAASLCSWFTINLCSRAFPVRLTDQSVLTNPLIEQALENAVCIFHGRASFENKLHRAALLVHLGQPEHSGNSRR